MESWLYMLHFLLVGRLPWKLNIFAPEMVYREKQAFWQGRHPSLPL